MSLVRIHKLFELGVPVSHVYTGLFSMVDEIFGDLVRTDDKWVSFMNIYRNKNNRYVFDYHLKIKEVIVFIDHVEDEKLYSYLYDNDIKMEDYSIFVRYRIEKLYNIEILKFEFYDPNDPSF